MVKKQEKNERKPQKCEENLQISELSTYPQASKTSVKLVTAYTPEGLESNINDWLDHADDCQIVDIKIGIISGSRTLYHALIVYSFTDEEPADE